MEVEASPLLWFGSRKPFPRSPYYRWTFVVMFGEPKIRGFYFIRLRFDT